jgi:hypothetical protein
VLLDRDVAVGFEAELRRELPRSHELFGRDLRAVARNLNHDDVLFQDAAGAGGVFAVHLTWNRESNPMWPSSVRYRDIDDFVERWVGEEDF